MDRLWLAHGSNATVEVELLVFGIAVCGLAFVFRPSGTGDEATSDGRTAVVTLVVGIALVLGAFAVPKL